MNRSFVFTSIGSGFSRRQTFVYAFIAAVLLSTPDSSAQTHESVSTNNVIKQEKRHGAVSVQITLDPASVRLGRDVLFGLTVRSPSSVEVKLPRIEDRAEGFDVNAVYDREPVTEDGITTLERRALLTPRVAKEYRLAPMPIVCTDRSKAPEQTDWFPTDPVELDALPVYSGTIENSLKSEPRITKLLPSVRAFLVYILLILFVCALIWAAIRTGKKLRTHAKIKRMSPAERALTRLDKLLAKKLIEKNRVKDFYIELTMIVRRYIEEQHGIRAPEQTTEEFLKTVSLNPDFRQEIIDRLKEFLEAADLVKFAAYKPSAEMIQKSVDTARQYIKANTGNNNV